VSKINEIAVQNKDEEENKIIFSRLKRKNFK
jgi:hypothetical protein